MPAPVVLLLVLVLVKFGRRHRDGHGWGYPFSPRAVPADCMKDWPLGDGRDLPMDAAEVPAARRGGHPASLDGPQPSAGRHRRGAIRSEVAGRTIGRPCVAGRGVDRPGPGRLAAGAVQRGNCGTAATRSCASCLGHGRRRQAASGCRCSGRLGFDWSLAPRLIWTTPRASRSNFRPRPPECCSSNCPSDLFRRSIGE